MNNIGLINILDILSRKGNVYMPDETNEKEVKKLLLGHSITKINGNTLKLDNGVELEFWGNEGCCCGAGWYDITELNECQNVITNVEFEDECNDKWGVEHSYKIFVYAENKKIKLLQCDGDDGNGYYGTGYRIKVKVKEEETNE